MTLAPVFRSPEAVLALQEKGYWSHLEESIIAHRRAEQTLNELLKEVVHDRYIQGATQAEDLHFLQDNFFLILFHSLFKTLNCPAEHLELYTLLNFCIRGVVLSGDNLFDDEDKLALPLQVGAGKRFRSIVQMICFQNLIDCVLERHGPWLSSEQQLRFKKDLLTRLTEIGTLEGSEENGVDHVPPVQEMVDSVHRVRGGALFSLAFIAPCIGESEKTREAWEKAETGIRGLGTAFQIVDDLTDLEFDLGRGSHNLVVSQITHEGTRKEQEILEQLSRSPELRGKREWIESSLSPSASAVLELARLEAETGFQMLRELGFWFDPQDALLFVRAIAGDAGFKRVQSLDPEDSSSTAKQ